MTINTLFVRSKKSIGGVQFDAVLNETHVNDLTITDNPVEAGVQVTDHVVKEPVQLTMEVVVTDTPLGFQAVDQIVDSVSGRFGSSTSGNVTRSDAAHNALVALQETAEPLTVQTSFVLYQNMLIRNITVARDKNTRRIAKMTVSMRTITILDTQVIELPEEQIAEDTKGKGSPNEERGRQEATDPDNGTETSVLKKITDWLG